MPLFSHPSRAGSPAASRPRATSGFKLGLGLTLGMGLALGLAAPAWASGLVDNVNGFTVAADGKVTRFTGLLVADDGTVEKLLERGDRRPQRPDWRHDAKGQVLMPGIIDAHGHVMGLGFQRLLLDLSDTNSLDEALARITQYARDNPDAPWILGHGWNQEKWGLGRFPTAQELDRAVPDRPVWLTRIDGHAGWANSRAMAAAKVTAATPAPNGGRIEKTGNQPSGVFVDAAMPLINNAVPRPQPRDFDRALAAAQRELLRYGITTVADMGTRMDGWQAMRRAGDLNRLAVRIIAYGAGTEEMVAIAGPGPTPWLYDDRLRMVGVKLYLDGALGSRGAWLKAPYSDAPDQSGLPLLSYSELRNRMVRAAMDGYQVAIHAIGDRANQEVLDAIDSVSDRFTGDRRWRVEHAQIVDPTDLPRFGRTGIIASMQPVHQTSDWRMAEARLGPNRLGGAYAWASMLANGGHIALGSDTPVESPNPFPGIAAAMTRQDPGGQPPGGWMPQQKLTREQALAGFTIDGAYAGFAEDRLGNLAPGKRADFILLAVDPLTAAPEEIRDAVVAETWVAGQRVYVRARDAAAGSAAPAASPTTAAPVRGENVAPGEGP